MRKEMEGTKNEMEENGNEEIEGMRKREMERMRNEEMEGTRIRRLKK